MPANQQTIEQRLAEFTEVHGTVLLGMHRELQSQIQRGDDRLEEIASDLRGYADKTLEGLSETAVHIDARYDQFNTRLNQFNEESGRREDNLQLLMVTHASQFSEAEQQLAEDTKRAAVELTELLSRTNTEAKGLIDNATRSAKESVTNVIHACDKSFADFTHRITDTEEKIRAYMVKQQKMLDAQSAEVRTLHIETQQLLVYAGQKIEDHQQREAAFNRKLRRVIVGLAVILGVSVVLGVGKLWIS